MNVHASLGRLALGGQPDRSSAPTRAAASVAAAGQPDESGRPAAGRAGRRELSTQAHLVALVAAILLPLLLGSGALIWRYAKAERVRQHQDAQALALELVRDVTASWTAPSWRCARSLPRRRSRPATSPRSTRRRARW